MNATPDWADDAFCYVTTTGRVSGRPHEIEIWFGYAKGSLYLLSGSGRRSDWVRNIAVSPAVRVRVRDDDVTATARFVEDADEESRARRMLAAKYQGWREGQELSDWASNALVVALDL